ncbi:MAG TPA: hypothetical protein VGD69_03690 [Herpetosiphonaceae bacterium]
MPYRFAHERQDYSDFAPGLVFSSLPGRPVFPVRLTDEIFQRCRARLLQLNVPPPYTVYDPCCGSGYLLSTLAYLHWSELTHLIGSDVDPDVLARARRNMSFLTVEGMDQRIGELQSLYEQFGKPSHADALARAESLRQQLAANNHTHSVTPVTFQANALSPAALAAHLKAVTIDMVLTDIPYGIQSTWIEPAREDAVTNAGWELLEALRGVIAPWTMIAITSNKQPRIVHDAYQRVEQLQIGKRRTLFYRLRSS